MKPRSFQSVHTTRDNDCRIDDLKKAHASIYTDALDIFQHVGDCFVLWSGSTTWRKDFSDGHAINVAGDMASRR